MFQCIFHTPTGAVSETKHFFFPELEARSPSHKLESIYVLTPILCKHCKYFSITLEQNTKFFHNKDYNYNVLLMTTVIIRVLYFECLMLSHARNSTFNNKHKNT